MIGTLAAIGAALVLLGGLVPAAQGHYTPAVGDRFAYTETVSVANGAGSYLGYTETTFINGSVSVTAVASNGSVTAHYQNTNHYVNNSRGNYNFSAAGTFYFDAQNFSYLYGTTDNQSNYTRPAVWFWMNASLPVGGTFYALDTSMRVDATAADYHLGTAAGAYVRAIAAVGSGAFPRNDGYGKFNATYTWQEYYDPTTGYVVGYVYSESDADGRGDGFSYTDRLAVTSTSYALTPAPAPATTPAFPVELVAAGIAIAVVVVVIAVALALRARRGPRLPAHSAGGAPSFAAPPVGGAPPPVHLTPAGEPAVQQIVVHETIKVKCAYCGGLIDAAATQCPFCGAARA